MNAVLTRGYSCSQAVWNLLTRQPDVSSLLVAFVHFVATKYLLPKDADIDGKRCALIESYKKDTVVPFIRALSGYLIKRVMVIAALTLRPIPPKLINNIISILNLERIARLPYIQAISLSRLIAIVTAIQIVRHLANINTQKSISKGNLEKASQFLTVWGPVMLITNAFHKIKGPKELIGGLGLLIGAGLKGCLAASCIRALKNQPPVGEDGQTLTPLDKGVITTVALAIIMASSKWLPWLPRATIQNLTILLGFFSLDDESNT